MAARSTIAPKLLYYHARQYNPVSGKFGSPDSIVPGAASARGGGAATIGGGSTTPLTVNFHEPGFVSQMSQHNATTGRMGFWFQLSGDEQQKAENPMGPMSPQALNRYSYGLNNPVKYTDPTGHTVRSDCAICGDWFSVSDWSTAAKIAAAIACVVIGCHVDFERNMLSGPTKEEWLDAGIGGLLPVATIRAFAPGRLARHFEDHAAEFGYTNVLDYLQEAQRITGGVSGNLRYIRPGGDTLFYDVANNEFAILAKDGQTIRTLYRPSEGLQYWIKQTGGSWTVDP